MIKTQNQVKVKIIQKMKTQKSQFTLTSLHDAQKNSKTNNNKKKRPTVIIIANRKILT